MIGRMIVNNFAHRPIRTLVSVLGVGVEVMLVVVVVGLTSGMIQEVAKRIEGVGADIMMQPPSASVLLALSSAPMPIRLREKLEEIDRVQGVAPVLLQAANAMANAALRAATFRQLALRVRSVVMNTPPMCPA